MLLMMVHTLPEASQTLKDFQPLLVVVMSPQVGQVPVIARMMTRKMTMMMTNQRTSSKKSLSRWVSARTRAATRMGWMSV